MITEDGKSGYEMAELAFEAKILSAEGNSNVIKKLADVPSGNKTCISVDGSAFGGFIEPVLKLAAIKGDVLVSAPESFEFILLSSDLFRKHLKDELEKTYDYADSAQYITWERYYESLIEQLTSAYMGFTYSKSKLDDYFKNDKCVTEYI